MLRTKGFSVIAAATVLGASATEAWAQDGAVRAGDTAWLLISAALVLFMLPGLALFYGGMARQKNALGTIMHSFFLIGLISVQWLVIGYTLSFGDDIGKVIGGLGHMFLHGVGKEAYPGTHVPALAFMMFQGMFAIITPALITGAFAERIRFSAFVIFSLLWAVFVYDPICHWVWGGGLLGNGGLLGETGALDFAGGTVVHISSGTAALVVALVIGRRRGWPRDAMMPHNLPLTVLGAGILWFGWFGFNAGSALASGGDAASAFVATHMAASAAVLAWSGAEYWQRGKASVLGAASGAVAGLVAITPAAGFVGPVSATVIGAVGGVLCYLAVNLKFRLGYDDSLDVVGVHGVGGTWGAIATGLFASAAVGGTDGLLFGNPVQLFKQIAAVGVTIVYAGAMTWVIVKIVDAVVGLRVNDEEEVEGLDLSQHGERAYNP